MMARLPEPAGLLLDRAEPVEFSFEGKRYGGFRGDTVASALAANDVTVLSRSFKYHRPRGIHSLSGLDANTLVQVGPAPNRFAERVPLAPDLEVTGQNYWGSLRHDRLAVFGLLHRFFPVGFYYKAFYKPRWTWPLWARMIRRIAGLGTVDTGAPHGYFDKQYLFCDVLVVGGGAAGLAAAAQAAEAGAEVVLVDENAALGGAPAPRPLRRERHAHGGRARAAHGRGGGERAHLGHDRDRVPRLVRRQLAASGARQPPLQAAGPDGGGRDRLPGAAPGLPQQRPARDHAGLRRAAPDQALRRQAGPPRGGGDGGRRRLWRGARPAGRGRRRGGGGRPAHGRRAQRAGRHPRRPPGAGARGLGGVGGRAPAQGAGNRARPRRPHHRRTASAIRPWTASPATCSSSAAGTCRRPRCCASRAPPSPTTKRATASPSRRCPPGSSPRAG